MVKFYTYLEVYLGDLHKKVSLSEFERHFKLPHQTVKSHLSEFVTSKIIIEEKKARFLYYKLNLDNPLTMEHLILCEKERTLHFINKRALFSRLYAQVSRFFKDSKMLLFGSCVEKKDFEDIDILIISQNKEIKKILKLFEETYSVKIHAVQTQEKDLTQTFIQEIMKKHIILNNHDYFTGVIYK